MIADGPSIYVLCYQQIRGMSYHHEMEALCEGDDTAANRFSDVTKAVTQCERGILVITNYH